MYLMKDFDPLQILMYF